MFYVCYKLIKQRYNKYKLHWKYDDSTTRGQNKINTHAFSNFYIFHNEYFKLMNVVNLRLLIYHLGNFKLFLHVLIEHIFSYVGQ